MLLKSIKKCLKSSLGGGSNGPIVSRRRHKLSRKHISPNALKVLYALKKAGYASYLVGGGVRDVLVGMRPKDFDIATDAAPEKLRKLFRNSRLIGRRFRIVHVYFRGEIIEVSTFRANVEESARDEEKDEPHAPRTDNVYGTIEEDTWRRDFTVNALYYNIADFSIVDYTGGMEDLKKGLIRMIGDPHQRFHEDPVRLLRAIRLSSKLNFKIQEDSEKAVYELSGLLQHVAPSRLFDETLKLFFTGHANAAYQRMQTYGYMAVLFPQLSLALEQRQNAMDHRLIELAMEATDHRFETKQSLNPGFLLSVLLWPALQQTLIDEKSQHEHFYQCLHAAIEKVLKTQIQTLCVPKRLTAVMRSIWVLQYHLSRRRGKRVYRTLHHRYFRAAFDFLMLRAESGEPHQDLVDWWRAFQDVGNDERQQLIDRLK